MSIEAVYGWIAVWYEFLKMNNFAYSTVVIVMQYNYKIL